MLPQPQNPPIRELASTGTILRGRSLGALGPGTHLGAYVIERHLGQGAEGNVFLARDSVLGRRVALKTLRAGTAGATRGVEEARMMASLEHPNIVRVYHVERHQLVWFVALEYVPGGSLHSYIRRVGPLPISEAVTLCAQAADALALAHQLGLTHRDVKPHNLLLTDEGSLKLSDFGLARVDGTRGGHQGPIGTPAFLAPECWNNEPATHAVDVYALGACLYYMLAGRTPFPFRDMDQLCHAHQRLNPKLPTSLPTAVQELILRMMAKLPEERPQCDITLVDELRRLARDPLGACLATASPEPRSSPLVTDDQQNLLDSVMLYGPEREAVGALITALQANHPVCITAPRLAEAVSLLHAALRQLAPAIRTCAIVTLNESTGSLRQAIVGQACPEAPQVLGRALARIGESSRHQALLEIRTERPLNAAQTSELNAVLRESRAQGTALVLLAGNAIQAPSVNDSDDIYVLALPPPDFETFALRVQAWFAFATEGRLRCTRDALVLLHHIERQGGLPWFTVCRASALIAAAAKLRLVTTWAVDAAHALQGPLRNLADVPARYFRPPKRWPDETMSARLEELRTSVAQAGCD